MEDTPSSYYNLQKPAYQPFYPLLPAPPHPPHPQQYYHHPPPPPHDPHSDVQDEMRTLFIAGLPGDVKHREIYNLFRVFPGYQSCQLRCSGHSSQSFAFAVFIDQQSAVTAMHALNGLVFDLDLNLSLHIDLAKSNSRSKRRRTDDGSLSNDNKFKGFPPHHQGFVVDSGFGSNIHMHGMGDYTSTQSHININYDSMKGLGDKKKIPSEAYVPQNNDPCPTLFVANLGSSCSEKELTQVFSSCPGFIKLKMQNKKGVPVAFIDFQDVACSTGALNHLQGFLFHSSEGEGMRLEYAKSRMGLRKRGRI